MRKNRTPTYRFGILIVGCITLISVAAIWISDYFQITSSNKKNGEALSSVEFSSENNTYTKSPPTFGRPIINNKDSLNANTYRYQNLPEIQQLLNGENFDSINEIALNVLRLDHGIEALKEIMGDTSVSIECRKSIAKVLTHSNTSDGINCVMVSALNLHRKGNPEDARQLLANLQEPLSIDGSNALLDILVGNDSSGVAFDSIPDEIRSLIRKSLCNLSDGRDFGKIMARIYLDLANSRQSAKANELLYGVSHPEMLAELVTLAHESGDSTQESLLFERLIQTDKPGVVAALSRLATRQPALLAQSSEAMFNWSFDRRERAQPGLFTEYLNDNTVSAEGRVVAAYGLAGMIGEEDAMLALRKAISLESDQHTKDCLNSAIASLQNGLANEPQSGDPLKLSK